MSTKIVAVCLIAVVCLIEPVDASESASKYLELSNMEAVVDEYGLAVFSGDIRNAHIAKYIGVYIHLVLKKNGLVIGTERFYLRPLKPLEVESFRHETLYTPEDYDEFYMLADGIVSDVNIDLVVGEVYLFEESFNVVAGVIYGEIRNDTNAIIGDLELRFTFFDARGDRLFIVSTIDKFSDEYDLRYTDIRAGDTAGFSIAFDRDLPFDKIKSKEVEIAWRVVDIVDEPIATGVEAAPWGQIKAMGR